MGTDKTRFNKIDWFMRALKTLAIRKEKAALDPLLGLYAINCNSTRKTGRQILRDLEDAGKVLINKEKREVSLPNVNYEFEMPAKTGEDGLDTSSGSSISEN